MREMRCLCIILGVGIPSGQTCRNIILAESVATQRRGINVDRNPPRCFLFLSGIHINSLRPWSGRIFYRSKPKYCNMQI
jgi:hypothetical protein